MKKYVFNAVEWNQTGDIGDNSQFWQIATILQIDGENQTAMVQFEDTGLVSSGHFISSMREVR